MRHEVSGQSEVSDLPAWHLHWQAALGREFLVVPSLRARIRKRLIDAHRVGGRQLIDFCLIPAEIHVIGRLGRGEVPADLARSIGHVVARWVRETQPIDSPVLAGPFRAHSVESLAALLHEIRCLAWRPVELGLCKGPTLHVDGGLRIALGRRRAEGFDARPLLALFGSSVSESRLALRQWVAKRPSDEAIRAWELARGLMPPGSGAPRASPGRVEVRRADLAALLAAAGASGIQGALQILTEWVCVRLGVSGLSDPVQGRSSQAARVHALVGHLAKVHGLCPSADVARHFARARSTLSEQMKAHGRLASDRDLVSTPLSRILAEVAEIRGRASSAAIHR